MKRKILTQFNNILRACIVYVKFFRRVMYFPRLKKYGTVCSKIISLSAFNSRRYVKILLYYTAETKKKRYSHFKRNIQLILIFHLFYNSIFQNNINKNIFLREKSLILYKCKKLCIKYSQECLLFLKFVS